jgi:ClpP class serine protease
MQVVIVVTPFGMVGSIGVYTMHNNLEAALDKAGVKRTYIYEGSRKVEGNPTEPLGAEAKSALQKEVAYTYGQFASAVAKYRGVPVATVRADPESADQHFGGGRTYHAREAVRLGMADRIATFDETLARAASGRQSRRASLARRRMSLS